MSGICPIEPGPEPHRPINCHRSDQSTTHVVGTVPHGHPSAPFILGKPVSHYPTARRPTHTVKPTHQEIQDSHQENCPSLVFRPERHYRHHHEHHRQGCQYQSQRQKYTRIAPVRNTPHQELGQRISNCVHGQNDAQLPLLKPKLRKLRHRHREIFAHNVKTGISDKHADKYLPAHELVSPIDLLLR